MDTSRRSFFGFLGGVIAFAPAVAQTAPGTPVRIDEWDEGKLRRFHIETDDDVEIGVFFWISPPPKGGRPFIHNGQDMNRQSRQVVIPLAGPEESRSVEERVADVQEFSIGLRNQHVIHVTHLRKATGVTFTGIAALPRQVTVDDMRLLIPARLAAR